MGAVVVLLWLHFATQQLALMGFRSFTICLYSFKHSSEVKVYDPSGESTLPLVPKKRKEREENEEEQAVPQKAKKVKIEIKG